MLGLREQSLQLDELDLKMELPDARRSEVLMNTRDAAYMAMKCWIECDSAGLTLSRRVSSVGEGSSSIVCSCMS